MATLFGDNAPWKRTRDDRAVDADGDEQRGTAQSEAQTSSQGA